MANKSTISIGFKIDNGKDGFNQLVLDANALRKALSSTVVESEKLDKRMINLSALATSLKSCKESLSELSGAIRETTGESVEFSTAMKATNTMAGKDEAGLGKLKDQVTELAKSVPMARDALAQGLYQVISNGVPEDNWISFLEDSSRAAVGGIADLGQTVGVTSTLIKNYGLSWDKAGMIQDKIQLTAKNGVTSFEQMAASLPKVTGNAATLGVSIDELMASFATLTGVSGNTAEVATQLGAIFTALVKPSSQAAEMAEKMGMRFDAAAIKAAGGFSNFIESLKRNVQSYAQSTGMLEQQIYSTLFGSAESVRALIPLTGELAGKFKENIAAMGDSAGTIDRAFDEMASTAEAKSQLLKNAFAGVRDFLSKLAAPVMPVIEFSETLLSAAANAYTLKEAVVKLGVSTRITALATSGLSAMVRTLGIRSGSTRRLLIVLTHAFKGGTMSALALKVAIRSLLIATGVGLALWALSEAVEFFAGISKKGADSASDMARSFDVEKRAAEMATEAAEAEASARKEASASLELHKSKLEAFMKNKGSKEEEIRLVNELNSAYGETMGYFRSVSEWYQALTANSKDYCRQLELEALQRRYADQKVELREQRRKLRYNDDGSEKVLSDKRKLGKELPVSANSYGPSGTRKREEIVGTSEREIVEAKEKEIDRKIEYLEKLSRETSDTLATIEMPVRGSKERPHNLPESQKGKTGKVQKSFKEVAPEGSIAHTRDQISDIEKRITFSIDPDEVYRLQREKVALQNQLKELELPLRIAESKEKIEEMLSDIKPVEIDVKVNTEDLTTELKEIPKVLTPAERLRQTLGTVSDVARSAGEAFKGMGQAFEIPALDVMGIIAGAVATMVQGFAQASLGSSDLGPFGWLAFSLTGLAQLTSMISQIKSVSAFADGGVVYGPTLGLVGEYAGASSNPEVIAPLNKLREIIGDTPANTPVVVGGRIELSGRTLSLVLENQSKITGLSGKRRY